MFSATDVGQQLAIDDISYHVAEHPAAPGMPYGQEGRQAVVYLVVGENGEKCALKVFKPRFRVPSLVMLASRLAAFADLPGLSVCERTVLSARRHVELLRQFPDLTYAVVMPWVEGPTWMEVNLERRALIAEQSLHLARSLADMLAQMEERSIAHCDLSGPNVLLPALAVSSDVASAPLLELVDVEQLYAPGLERPAVLPSGSPGYAHRTTANGLWGPDSDRFAGAILLGEMLGRCDERVQSAAWDEGYFDPNEVQQDSQRYLVLTTVLRERWGGGIAGLFDRAWHSETLSDCPTFGDWLVALPERSPAAVPVELRAGPSGSSTQVDEAVRQVMDGAHRLEGQGNVAGALEAYRHALSLVPTGSGLATELALIIQDMETHLKEHSVARGTDDLGALFGEALAAYKGRQWARAEELLAEVVRRQPDGYERHGYQAEALLADVEKRLGPPQTRQSIWLWIGSVAALALLVGILELTVRGQAEARAAAQAQAAVETQATQLALAREVEVQTTVTRVAQAATEKAQAQATETVIAVATNTAVARSTSEARATAQAQATMTAEAQATLQTIAQATQEARRRETARAVIGATIEAEAGATSAATAAQANAAATATAVAASLHSVNWVQFLTTSSDLAYDPSAFPAWGHAWPYVKVSSTRFDRTVEGSANLDEILYGDLSGDGRDEAAIFLDSGGNAGYVGLLVYTQEARSPILVKALRGVLLRASVEDGQLLVQSNIYGPESLGMCCPSAVAKTWYKLRGNELVTIKTENIRGSAP